MLRGKTLAALLFLLSIAAIAQDPATQTNGRILLPPPHPRCALSEATNGEMLTVEGNVIHEPHDLAFFLPRCDEVVLLTYAGDADSDVSKADLHIDKNLRRFRKYTSSLYQSSGTDICIDCSVYGNILAVVTGKLEIASLPADATQDGESGDDSRSVIGVVGWGHPTPFTRYRLVIESVASVKAKKRPRP
jgi:hypothetical protein